MPHTPEDQFLRKRTLAALHDAWTDVQRAANAGVDLAGPGGPEALLTAARRVSVLDKRLKTLTVITARVVYRVGWEEIGRRLRVDGRAAELLYGGAVQRWLSGDAAPWLPHIPGATVVADGHVGCTGENGDTLSLRVKAVDHAP